MPFVIPNEGELRLLNEVLDGSLARELDARSDQGRGRAGRDRHGGDAHQDHGHGLAGLCGQHADRARCGSSTWNTPANGSPTNAWSAEASVAESAYGSAPITFTNNHATNIVTVTGYQMVGATSGKLIAVETFATARTLNPNDQLQLTPRFGLG